MSADLEVALLFAAAMLLGVHAGWLIGRRSLRGQLRRADGWLGEALAGWKASLADGRATAHVLLALFRLVAEQAPGVLDAHPEIVQAYQDLAGDRRPPC